jgi:hypothetical protein
MQGEIAAALARKPGAKGRPTQWLEQGSDAARQGPEVGHA